MTSKEECKEFALKYKEQTGKFPLKSDWTLKGGFPYSRTEIIKLFGSSYSTFIEYCGEAVKIRTQPVSIEWIKNNSTIDSNNCWNWGKNIRESGYGRAVVEGKSISTHRLAYELVHGEIPESLLVRHKCDNKICCNPDHLELGTQQQNILDFYNRNPDHVNNTNGDLIWKLRNLKTLQERIDFYLEHTINENGCCVSNILKTKKDGYYIVSFDSKHYRLHRLILAIKLNKNYNEIDVTRHTCNNRSCINPGHLIEGTVSDNSLDSREYSKATKLSKENVIDIKSQLLVKNFTAIGSKSKFDKFWADKFKFKVSPSTITSVRLNNSWKDVIVGENK